MRFKIQKRNPAHLRSGLGVALIEEGAILIDLNFNSIVVNTEWVGESHMLVAVKDDKKARFLPLRAGRPFGGLDRTASIYCVVLAYGSSYLLLGVFNISQWESQLMRAIDRMSLGEWEFRTVFHSP